MGSGLGRVREVELHHFVGGYGAHVGDGGRDFCRVGFTDFSLSQLEVSVGEFAVAEAVAKGIHELGGEVAIGAASHVVVLVGGQLGQALKMLLQS